VTLLPTSNAISALDLHACCYENAMVLYIFRSTEVAIPLPSPRFLDRLVLLGAGGIEVLVLSRQDCRAVVDAAEGLGGDGRAVCADSCADGHEEAVAFGQYRTHTIERTKAYPNVAAEPAIYCPRVRSMPFGPGPNRTMFVKPRTVRKCLS
jgi:hypothetical protein